MVMSWSQASNSSKHSIAIASRIAFADVLLALKKLASVPAIPSVRRLFPALNSFVGQPRKLRYLITALEM